MLWFLRLWLRVVATLMVLCVVFRTDRARVHTVIEERERDYHVRLSETVPTERPRDVWVWAPIDA